MSNLSAQTESKKQIDSVNSIISFTNCDLDPFLVDNGKFGIKYNGPETLQRFFEKNFGTKILNEIEGEVWVQALINKHGKICCKSVSSPTGLSVTVLDNLKCDVVLKKMSTWRAAVMDGKRWNSNVLISIKFSKSSHVKAQLLTINASNKKYF